MHVVDVASNQLLEHSQQTLNLVVGHDGRRSSFEQSLPESNESRDVSSLFPEGGGEERTEEILVGLGEGGGRVEFEELGEDLEDVGDELLREGKKGREEDQSTGFDGWIGKGIDKPRTSCCRMVMMGPKSSDSNCPRVAGVPSATNLCQKTKPNRVESARVREVFSTKQRLPLENRDNSPNQGRHRLESVLVKLGVTGVLADLTDDSDEVLKDDEEDGSEGLSSGKDDSHDAWTNQSNR